MRLREVAMSFRLTLVIAPSCLLFCVGCKSNHKGGPGDMKESVAFPLSAAYEDRFAISPDGTKVVHAPTSVSVGNRERGRPFEVRDARTSTKIGDIELPIEPAIDNEIDGIQYCDNGKYLLVKAGVYYDPDHPPQFVNARGPNAEVDYLRIVDMKSYALHTDISLSAVESNISEQVLAQAHGATETGGSLSFVSCAANAPIAATVIRRSSGMNAIEIFNLETGEKVAGTEDLLLQAGITGVAISPEGTSFAVFGSQHIEGMDRSQPVDYQMTIVDLRKQKVARDILIRSPFNFNAMKYAGESTIAIELFDQKQYELPPDKWTGPLNIFDTRASIHFFDVGSGGEVRTISRPDNGEFRLLDISADGRAMLVRTDSDHFCFSCNWGGGMEAISDSRFELWNPQTGHLITRSPSLKVVRHRCLLPRWMTSGGWVFGDCIAYDEEPELKLSQSGNAVAALWNGGNEPILVYSLAAH